ncbi:MAG: lysostaphin resistance A-like protein [Isosphaeraceae bacterium]
MNQPDTWLGLVGLLLFLQLGAMLIANAISLLDRVYGIRWLVSFGLRPPVRWSIPFFFVAWLVLIAIQSLLFVLLNTIPQLKDGSNKGVVTMATVSLANLLFVMLYIRISGPGRAMGMKRLGLTGPDLGRQIGIGFRTAMLAAPWVYATNLMANLIFENNPHAVMKMLDDGISPTTAALAGLSAVVTAPLAEEVLFRGILLGALVRKSQVVHASRRKIRVQLANVVTSLIFAALHADAWPAPIGIFVLSLVLGKLYITTGRLWPCIAAHALFNSTGVLGMIFAVLSKKAGMFPASGFLMNFW